MPSKRKSEEAMEDGHCRVHVNSNSYLGRGRDQYLTFSLYVFHVKFGVRWWSDNKSGHTKGEGGKFASLVQTASPGNPYQL